MRPAFCTVARRCAMTSVVRPFSSASRPCCTRRSARGVERARRLVEQQDRPVGEQRARDRQALLLAAGKRDAALAERRVEPLRQALDELERAGLLAGRAAPPRASRPAGRNARFRARWRRRSPVPAAPRRPGGAPRPAPSPAGRCRRCAPRPAADRRSAGAARIPSTCPRPKGRPAPRARPGRPAA